MDGLRQEVSAKKRSIAALIESPLTELADCCRPVWEEADALDACLDQGLESLPFCSHLYAIAPDLKQLSSNVGHDRIDLDKRAQDLSERPYLSSTLPYRGFVLSNVYINRLDQQPCITAVQAVSEDDRLLGFLLADFELKDLPLDNPVSSLLNRLQQFKGDPAIRSGLFGQERVQSFLDEHIDDTHAMVNTLMHGHGVFHAKLHYSSSRITLWLMADPFSYRIHGVEEILDPEICLAYPPRAFPSRASIEPLQIKQVLEHFKALRTIDSNIYLRSGSLNLINGMVGLTFSCDGSYYIPVEEFIRRSLGFWLGTSHAG